MPTLVPINADKQVTFILFRYKWYFVKQLELIETLHKKLFIHRDIKPQNFCFSKQHPDQLYLIDFGLSKRFVQKKNGTHIPYRDQKQLVGTPRYASINAHKGIELSRRDDLESLGYLIVYLLKGVLPWQNIASQNRDHKNKMIQDIKENTPIHKLCEGLHCSLIKYFQYVRQLKFTDAPDYKYLKKLFTFQQGANDTSFQVLDERTNNSQIAEQSGRENVAHNFNENCDSNEAMACDRGGEGEETVRQDTRVELTNPLWKLNATFDDTPSPIEEESIPSEHEHIVMHLPSILAYNDHNRIIKVFTMYAAKKSL